MTKLAISIIIGTGMTPHASAQRIKQRDKALALGVGLFLFALFLLSYRGGFHSVDEVSMFAVTESLVKFGRLNTDQIAWTQWTTSQREAQGFFGVDGHVYSKKGLAISLAMVPLYWLGLVTPGLGMLQTTSLLNPIITAATGSLLYFLLRRLGYDSRIAIGVVCLYGTATIAWVYSKYLFSEPLVSLLLLATTYLLIVFRHKAGYWRLALAGLLAGLAVATRANNLFLLPVFGLYTIAVRKEANNAENDHTRSLGGGALRAFWFLLGLIPPALLVLGYNWIRTGNALQTGYDLTIFSPDLLIGLYKLLFSPLRGFFVYSPILILSVPGLAWLWQRYPSETTLTVGITGITVLVFSVWSSGEGLSWGSRFLVPIVPFLCVGLAPVLERILRGSVILGTLLLALSLLSLVIQLLGIIINPWVYLAQLQAEFGGEFFLERTPALTDFRYIQAIGQIRSWSAANSDLAWWQPWGFDAIAFGLCLILVAVAIANLKLQTSPAISRPSFSIATCILAIVVAFPLMVRYFVTDQQFGPPDRGYIQALKTADARATPGENLITIAPYHYHVPMNRFKGRLPILGLAQSSPPLPETALRLLRGSVTGTGAQLITVGLPPAALDNAVEQWLAYNAFKSTDDWFDDARLVWYGVEKPMATRPIDETLGQELELAEINLPESSHPGHVLPVEFIWIPLQNPSADYSLFLQLLAPDGTLVAEHDSAPNGGYTSTSTWPPGEEVSDRHGLALPEGLPTARYQLITGMYNPATGERLPTEQSVDYVKLGTILVESPTP